MRKFIFFSTLIVVCAAVAGAISIEYARKAWIDATIEIGAPIRFDVSRGEAFRTTARRLEAEKLVPNGDALRWWARWNGLDVGVRSGAYRFDGTMTPRSIVETLNDGENWRLRVTIPEGLTLHQVADRLAAEGLGELERFLELATSESFARSRGVEAETLEGYLFPETYFFSPFADEAEILRAMIERFRKQVGDGWDERCRSAGFEPHEAVILASIVEKETSHDDERRRVAAVFHNRLKRGMKLQTDPTVIYGIENFDGNLTRKHLETETRYNTYVIQGLPAGPISNPGLASLEAVLDPASTDDLYFVSRNDGTHEFNETFEAHDRAVTRYQRRRGSR